MTRQNSAKTSLQYFSNGVEVEVNALWTAAGDVIQQERHHIIEFYEERQTNVSRDTWSHALCVMKMYPCMNLKHSSLREEPLAD